MDPGPQDSRPQDSTALGHPCTLGWRLRDLQDGSLKFGRDCTGEITFWRDGGVEGRLFGVPGCGTVEFQGERGEGECVRGDLMAWMRCCSAFILSLLCFYSLLAHFGAWVMYTHDTLHRRYKH